jgi:hypothetical protein
LPGTAHGRSINARARPEGITALLHKLGKALEQSRPKKVRVSIEL